MSDIVGSRELARESYDALLKGGKDGPVLIADKTVCDLKPSPEMLRIIGAAQAGAK